MTFKKIPLIKGFPRSCFPKVLLSFHLIEFSMTKLFNSQKLLYHIKTPWCTTTRQGYSKGTKSTARDTMHGLTNKKQTKQTNKQIFLNSQIWHNKRVSIWHKNRLEKFLRSICCHGLIILFTHSSCHDPMKGEYRTNIQVPKQQFGGICLSRITEL